MGILKGTKIWAKYASKPANMTPEEKRVLGVDLLVGREANKADKPYGEWLKANDLPYGTKWNALRSECQRLADDDIWAYWLAHQDGSLREVLTQYAVEFEGASIAEIVRTAVLEHGKKTSATIEKLTGVPKSKAGDCLRDLYATGDIGREKRGVYCPPCSATVKDGAAKTTEGEKEKRTLIGNAIAAATNRLESEVMKIIMPTADGLDRMTKAEVKEALAFLSSIQAHGGNKKQPKNGVMETSKNDGDQRPGREDYLFETVFTVQVEVK